VGVLQQRPLNWQSETGSTPSRSRLMPGGVRAVTTSYHLDCASRLHSWRDDAEWERDQRLPDVWKGKWGMNPPAC